MIDFSNHPYALEAELILSLVREPDKAAINHVGCLWFQWNEYGSLIKVQIGLGPHHHSKLSETRLRTWWNDRHEVEGDFSRILAKLGDPAFRKRHRLDKPE